MGRAFMKRKSMNGKKKIYTRNPKEQEQLRMDPDRFLLYVVYKNIMKAEQAKIQVPISAWGNQRNAPSSS